MRVIFICKRYYTNKDVIRHRFGRLYELPTQLAGLGNEVTVLCLDYRGVDDVADFVEYFGSGSVSWTVISKKSLFDFKVLKIYRSARQFHPDLVLGSSDIPCLWLSNKLAHYLKVPNVVDLYDNYESFGQARIPGFRHVLRSCVRAADLVLTVSTSLRTKVLDEYEPRGPVVVMVNGITRHIFFRGDRRSARASLGLPASAKLVGTAGTLSKMKGLDTVCNAWSKIRDSMGDVYLVLAGALKQDFSLPVGERVIYLGELSEEMVGNLFRALDVGIVPAQDSAFGRYCFPQKLFEMVACGLPVVGAKVGAIEEVLHSTPSALFEAGSEDDLAKAVLNQLERPQCVDVFPKDWAELVKNVAPLVFGSIKQL